MAATTRPSRSFKSRARRSRAARIYAPPNYCRRYRPAARHAKSVDTAGAQTEQNQQPAPASGGTPNILVIFGDDIGITNISAYSHGLMGYHTPNIDSIAQAGVMFLHYYGEQSCTAGRAAFLTGLHGIRTGLTKVGFPGAPMGMSQLDPTMGGLLKISATPRASSARTTSAIATTRCRR